jgi:TonB-dependent starch-binding outer membrane protein SusC
MKFRLLLLFVMLSLLSYGQRQIQGKVTDENDQALPGVNILVKGTSQGTVSDADGAYMISASDDAILIFSFIGYVPQEIPVGNQTNVSVKLLPDIKALEEVVVVGYGTTTVKELTGSVLSVQGKDIQALNPVRIDQAMQGRSAGMQISTASGSPGGAMSIRIRGISTNGNPNPLVLVDGIIYSIEGLNALNPDDVESVDVLKDASAAIYGVLGANGVIFITTKKGRKNSKPTVDVSGYYGIQESARKMSLLSAREFAVLKNEAFAAGGQTPPYANPNLGKGTDWQDIIFDNAPIQNYNVSINGGTEKSMYSFGGSYLSQMGIIGDDKASYKRINGRLNFTTDLMPKVSLQSVLLFTNERRHTLSESGIGSVLYNTINASPLASVRNPDGSFTYLEEFSDIINPVAQIANTYNDARVNKFVGKEELTYKINKNFEVTGRAGYTYAIVDDKSFNPLVYYGSGKAQNSAVNAQLDPPMREIADGVEVPVYSNVTEGRTTFFSYNIDAFVNFNRTFAEAHKVKATLGTSLFSDQGKGLWATAYNIPYNSYEFADISMANPNDLLNSNSSWQNEDRLLSAFVRAEYSYRDKYLVSVILRRDGSTKFGRNYKFGRFPSITAGWVVTEEPFFNADFVDFLKVRASYGIIGNDRIGSWAYRGLLGGEGVYPFGDQLSNGVAVGVLPNPDLRWETTHQTNFGTDLTLFNDKINVTADYYIKTTKDLLFQPDISGVAGSYGPGGRAPYINAGNVRNSGFEITIGYSQSIGNDFKFNVSYNLTTIKNEVTDMPVDFIPGAAFSVGGGPAVRMQTGYPIGYFFGYKTQGIYQTQTEISERGVTQDGAQPGDLRFADLDGDGVVNFSNDTDKTIIGSPIPDALMGLNLGVNFKGFDLSGLLYASLGNEILRNYERQQPLANQLKYKIGRWTGEGSTNEDPRLTTGANRNGVLSDYFVEDGSYLRIKNVQLGYSLPTSLTKKIGATKIRVYMSVNNLATFTKYRGFDVDNNNGSPLGSGIDNGFYPQARTYMAGLNLNF